MSNPDNTTIRLAVEPPPLGRILEYGMSGDDVKLAQTLLQAEGFFDGTPLGNFLKKTRESVRHFQGTHIGRNGQLLKVDDQIGPETWWALHNPNGSAQRNYVPTEERATSEKDLVGGDPSLRLAFLAFLYKLHKDGTREIPDGSNYGDGVTAIVNACGFKYGIAWCLATLSHAFKQVHGDGPLGAMHVGCSLFWNEAMKRGLAFRKSSYVPTPGDFAIYNYGSGLNSKGHLSGPGHAVGVVRVSEDASRFNGIEGNAGNRVKHTVRKKSEPTLVGFVNPHGDHELLPIFTRGVTEAPEIVLSLADSR